MDSQNNQNQSTQVSNNTLMGVLAYLGPLVIISYITSKDNAFVKFHIKQGLVVFALEVIAWILASMLWSLWMIVNLINIATLVFSILGIINVVQGKMKELPIIGGFAKNFNI